MSDTTSTTDTPVTVGTGPDIDAITASVRQRLGQTYDPEAAARDDVDPDRFIFDTENAYQKEDAPSASGEGSGGAGDTAPTAPTPPAQTSDDDAPIVVDIDPDDLEPVAGQGKEHEPEVEFVIPGVTDDSDTDLGGGGDSSGEGPAAPPVTDATPPPGPSSDRFDYSSYFELMYGEVPPVEQVEATFAFVERVNSLPPEYQQIVGAMVDGRFDPVEFAKAMLPAQAPAADPDPWLDPDTPAPSTSDPRVAAMERELQQIRQRDQQRESQYRQQMQQQIVAGVDQAMTEFRQANRHLTAEQFAVLARKVNASPGWAMEVERGADPRETYSRYLTAQALADPRFASALAPPASAAPIPDPTPRQAANAAIAGTNSPSAPSPGKRRSPLGDGSPRTPAKRPSNDQELRDALRDGVEELFG
jgi:hypothetical protein